MEDTYPQAFIDRVNSKRKGTIAEAVSIDKVVQNKDGEYAVIIDRISRSSLLSCVSKNAALTGTNVINNPFWWSADDDKFFNNSLADTLGVPLPNTVLLPSREHQQIQQEKSFRT
jgi:glutathione synthase/RimK-type ligase-like ATP-grasp enzyme